MVASYSLLDIKMFVPPQKPRTTYSRELLKLMYKEKQFWLNELSD
jgi:hypothetical protein